MKDPFAGHGEERMVQRKGRGIFDTIFFGHTVFSRGFMREMS